MYKIGEKNKLKILHKGKNSIILENDIKLDSDDINFVYSKISKGDYIDVTLYKIRNELRATTKVPKAYVGQIAKLKVIDKVSFGVFLDWGLNSDVLLPLSETIGAVNIGDYVTVALYIDEISNRITASMKLNKFLNKDPKYNTGDRVKGIVYSINKEIGVFVVVDEKYNGLIRTDEISFALNIGDELDLIVKGIREDGNINLYFDTNSINSLSEDINTILEKIKLNRGFLKFDLNSNEKDIKRYFNMDKNRFIKAINHLEAEDMIISTKKGIKLNF